MNQNPGAPSFDTAMRGYERSQVDAKVAAITAERMAFEQRAAELERELKKMRESMVKGEDAPYYITLSKQIESILRAADDDKNSAEAEAEAFGMREREQAEAAGAKMRESMEKQSADREADARQAGERAVAEARSDGDRMRAETTEKAAATVAGAGDIVEKSRTQGAQIATEVETKLNAQREQFERDVVSRQETAERRLAETAQLAEQMKSEAARMTDDSQRAAKALIEAARTAATELVTETASRAERLQQDAERELAALTHRRDSVNAQLSTVRETLANLSGSTAALAGMGQQAQPK